MNTHVLIIIKRPKVRNRSYENVKIEIFKWVKNVLRTQIMIYSNVASLCNQLFTLSVRQVASYPQKLFGELPFHCWFAAYSVSIRIVSSFLSTSAITITHVTPQCKEVQVQVRSISIRY